MYYIRKTTITYPPVERETYVELLNFENAYGQTLSHIYLTESETEWYEREALGPYWSKREAEIGAYRQYGELEERMDGQYRGLSDHAVKVWIPIDVDPEW